MSQSNRVVLRVVRVWHACARRCSFQPPLAIRLAMSDLFALLYRSRAVRALDERDLLPVLTTSLRNNARAGVTGLLLYGPAEAPPPTDDDAPLSSVVVPFDGPGVFVQWLEGPKAAVRETFERISADPRHTDVHMLGDGLIRRERRLFPSWAMALEMGYPLPATPEEMEAFAAAHEPAPTPTDPAAR